MNLKTEGEAQGSGRSRCPIERAAALGVLLDLPAENIPNGPARLFLRPHDVIQSADPSQPASPMSCAEYPRLLGRGARAKHYAQTQSLTLRILAPEPSQSPAARSGNRAQLGARPTFQRPCLASYIRLCKSTNRAPTQNRLTGLLPRID